MFSINDAAKAKKSARALEKFLKKHGHGLGHGQALNAIAAMAGFEDWNGLQAQLKDAPAAELVTPNIWDVNFEKVNVVNVFGSHYAIDDLEDFDRVKDWLSNWDSAENPFGDKNPIALRLASQNEDAYGSAKLRVKELLSFKWDAEQQCFVSPEQGRMSLYELAPYQFKRGPAEPVNALPKVGEEKVKPMPTILDVDFSRVTGLKKGGEGFWVDSRYYAEALDWLTDWNNPTNENDPDVPVLELTYIDDHGFVAHTQILANELLALKWSPSTGAFVSPSGVEYAFTAEESVIPGTLPRCLPVKVKAGAEEHGVPPQRYEVDVYSIESDENTCSGREHVETWVGTATSEKEAESKALAEVWDSDLEASGAEPSCDVREVGDEEEGPFEIITSAGHTGIGAYQSFSKAWQVAEKLFEQYGRVHSVEISDGNGAQVQIFKK